MSKIKTNATKESFLMGTIKIEGSDYKGEYTFYSLLKFTNALIKYGYPSDELYQRDWNYNGRRYKCFIETND